MNQDSKSFTQCVLPLWVFTLLFAGLLHVAWVGAWLLEQHLELRAMWLTTSGSRSAYWLAMKLLLWVLPALLLIRLSGKSVGEVMGFHRARAIAVWGGGVGLVLGITALAAKTLGSQPLFPPSLSWSLFSGVLVAPIVEELTFRGALLGPLCGRFGFWTANTITGLLFLGIHLPGWHFQGRLAENLTNPVGGALSVFLLGLLFGYVAHKSRSVAAGTLTHILNNLFSA